MHRAKIEVSSFRKTEMQLLKYIRNKNRFDISKLPAEDELRDIYAADPLISYVESILLGYRKKIGLLEKL